jgi:hypothetical protein
MSNVNSIKMKEQEKSDLEKSIRAHITVVDELPFRIADDDPFLKKISSFPSPAVFDLLLFAQAAAKAIPYLNSDARPTQ